MGEAGSHIQRIPVANASVMFQRPTPHSKNQGAIVDTTLLRPGIKHVWKPSDDHQAESQRSTGSDLSVATHSGGRVIWW